jgi:hypothetical protein
MSFRLSARAGPAADVAPLTARCSGATAVRGTGDASLRMSMISVTSNERLV